jgi:hypothetical protein
MNAIGSGHYGCKPVLATSQSAFSQNWTPSSNSVPESPFLASILLVTRAVWNKTQPSGLIVSAGIAAAHLRSNPSRQAREFPVPSAKRTQLCPLRQTTERPFGVLLFRSTNPDKFLLGSW